MGYVAQVWWSGARYGESSTEFIALIALARIKGRPIGYVLARHILPHNHQEKCRDEMLALKSRMVEKEVKRFWPLNTEGENEFFDHRSDRLRATRSRLLALKEFPECRCDRWKATSPWLYHLVVEPWYTHISPKSWQRVSARQWKKKPSRIEKIVDSTVLLEKQLRTRQAADLHSLILDRKILTSERMMLEEWIGNYILVCREHRADHGALSRKIEKINQAIALAAKKKPKIDDKFLKPVGRIRRLVRLVLV